MYACNRVCSSWKMPQSSLMRWLTKSGAPCETEIQRQSNTEKPEAEAASSTHSERQQDRKEIRRAETGGFSLQALSPNVELRSCRKDDIPHLKRLTSLLLPIPYSDKFFREIIDDSLTNDITLLAMWHDDPHVKGKQKGRLVGAIRCRLLTHPPISSPTLRCKGPMLYLSTLVLLSPYRSHGIATHLLQSLTQRAIENYGISSIGAHVWEANQEGLDWYRKRGFREVSREIGYYRRLDPQDAIVMEREVTVSDLLGK